MLKEHDESIGDDDFEQIFSYDFYKERAEKLESELCVAKIELKMAQEMENFWYESYEELNKTFMNYLETR
jgi:hypothetical protein